MHRISRTAFVVLALTSAVACSIRDAACGRPTSEIAQATPDQVAVASRGTTAPQHFRIVFLGDSLTAGLGLLTEDAYPRVIQQKFTEEGYANVEIANASISGDTTAGGAERLESALDADAKILVLALGGNDALRGLPVEQTRENLTHIIEGALSRNMKVLLAGMEAPTNLGEDYQQAFHAVFIQLARTYRDRVVYMPFLLEGVAGHPELNQSDGIHPNKTGAGLIAEHMYPKLRLMVDEMGGGG
jgi:acyl-CoA thioesterase-1